MNTYRSFGITIRPRGGLTDVLQTALKAYCAKCNYASMITEKEDSEKHAHIQVWCNDGKYKGDVKRAFVRICEKYIDDWDIAQKKYCIYIKICYNNWIENYCEDNDIKIDDNEIIYDNKPLYDEEFYPSMEEQDAVKSKINAVDKYYHDLSIKFNDWILDNNSDKILDNITIGIIAKFLAWAMFDEKIIKVKKDKRDRINLCRNLYLYVSKNASAFDFLNKEDEELYYIELENSLGMSNVHCPNDQ